MESTLTDIYTCAEAGGLMQPVRAIQAIEGTGLEGDRYASGAGTYSRFPGAHDVTLFANESLWEFEGETGIRLHPSQTRRNLFTEGVDLNALINVEFSIGPVRMRGLRFCPPCLYLAQMLKMPVILKGLAHRGGIYAEVVQGGLLSAGDRIVV